MSANDNHTKAENVFDQAIDQPVDLANEHDFQLGALFVRPSSREVVLDGRAEMLEPRVLQVLIVLARRRGEVVSREQLVELCWGGRVVSEDAINRSITKVRRWSAPKTFVLETIPRVGYRLVAAEPSKPVTEHVSEPVAPRPRRYSRRRKIVIGFIAVLVLCIAFGSWMSIDYWRDMNRPYFAVLHFDVTGSDPAAAELADVLSTAINHRLTSQGFNVVSPAVSNQYRGERKSQAGEALGPRYLIDGDVRITGTRVSVAVRVDSTLKPVTIWSREFDASLAEAKALPEKICIVLAGLFSTSVQPGLRLPPEVAAGMLKISELRTQGKDMDAYLAAKQLMREAPTHYTSQIQYGISVGEAIDLMPSAERADLITDARKQVELADRIVWGTLPTIRYLLMPTVDWSMREQVLREGLTKDHSDESTLRYLLSSMLIGSGRVAEAVELAQQSVAMDSFSTRNAVGYASVLDVSGRREAADSLLEKADRLWPELESIQRLKFSSALARSDFAAATSLLQDPAAGPILDPPAERRPYAVMLRALEKHNATDIATVERDCADPAKLARDRATWCLQGLIALGRLDTFFQVAPAYFPEMRGATAAERDARWLEAPRVQRYMRFLFRSDAQAVRADPRFIPIVERLGLLDYWRTSDNWPDFCKSEPESVCGRMREVSP